jgi:hypothetical protein
MPAIFFQQPPPAGGLQILLEDMAVTCGCQSSWGIIFLNHGDDTVTYTNQIINVNFVHKKI